mgnify:CR=1 FL=1
MAECFFHTGRPSVIRCKQCGRPLCSECRMVKPEGIFCSQKCADTFKVFAERLAEIEAKRSKISGMNPLIRLIIFLVALFIIFILVKQFIL